ncbi:MAG: malto-oligosyltrehalose synthase [Thermoplasmata archaeon]
MERRIPSATYRVQLTPSWGFDAAASIVPYLARLGVDTLYVSPILASRRGSTHGYDGIDPRRLDTARGGNAGFARLRAALKRHGMGLLVDIVPNHLAATLENPAFVEVLERGPRSRYARIFDIDWSRGVDGRAAVVLPWLDRDVEAAFDAGMLRFVGGAESVRLRLRGNDLPASPRARRRLLAWARTAARSVTGPADGSSGVRSRTILAKVNEGATPEARDRRRILLEDFHFRLVPWWEFASINYRRFFDISDLIGVRSDEAKGFTFMHRWLVRAARAGWISGVRVDHVDGLADPSGYLRRLAEALRGPRKGAPAPYIVVEKILARDETLPGDWPVAGTTGYDALQRMTGAIVDPPSLRRLTATYRAALSHTETSFADIAERSKREVVDALFPGELAGLVDRLRGTSAPSRSSGAPPTTGRALTALTAALPVYRTYGTWRAMSRTGRRRIRTAFDAAVRRASGRAERAALRELQRRWLRGGPATGERSPRDALVRWEQWTGAVAAKGIEDTAFYRYAAFLAANEVGGDPGHPSTSLEEFHAFMRDRSRRWPHALTPTSTHDTKWGEDARARLIALAEWAGPWGANVRQWVTSHRSLVPGRGATRVPFESEEYRLYQTLVAVAAASRSLTGDLGRRVDRHLVKAARERKEGTSWTHPCPSRERRLRAFSRALRTDPRAGRFRREFVTWVDRVAFFGAYYSLAQVVLRATVPGVPDLYQGSEGWNFSLVDPDNRRPVDFGRLASLLRRSERRRRSPFLTVSDHRPPDEVDKVSVTASVLRFRRDHPRIFDSGGYHPLHEVVLPAATATLAFARRWRDEWVVVAFGRGLAQVSGHRLRPPTGRPWKARAIRLPPYAPTRWQDVLGSRTIHAHRRGPGRTLPLAELFDRWPVAVLYHGASTARPGPAVRGGARPPPSRSTRTLRSRRARARRPS